MSLENESEGDKESYENNNNGRRKGDEDFRTFFRYTETINTYREYTRIRKRDNLLTKSGIYGSYSNRIAHGG
ncbi:hypothetical protein Lac3_30290 [Claveliimonas bilis]|nr:hypothetical protein Lac3_30290 [Claveliimonas bilis]